MKTTSASTALMILSSFVFAFVLIAIPVRPVAAQTAAEREIFKIEDEWNKANETSNQAYHATILAPDFVQTNDDGAIVTRAMMLAPPEKDPAQVFVKGTFSDKKVRIYGNMAVFTCIYDIDWLMNKKPVHRQYRAMDVFIRTDDVWKCVASHGTLMKEMPAAKKDAAGPKKSTD